MQIILSKEECETIDEALITEIEELLKQKSLDDRRGRDLTLVNKYISKAEALRKRFSQYV